MMSNIQLMRLNRAHNSVESSEIQYNQSMTSNQQILPMTSNIYDRQTYKRKNDFGDGSTYRNDKIMRTNYNMVHGLPKDYENLGLAQDKQVRRFSPGKDGGQKYDRLNSDGESTNNAFLCLNANKWER